MRYRLTCTSIWNNEDIIRKYSIVNNYNPIIDYPYPNPQADRLTIEVDDLTKFYDDIGEEIIIGRDYFTKDNLYCLEIYDDYRE